MPQPHLPGTTDNIIGAVIILAVGLLMWALYRNRKTPPHP